MRTQKVDLGKVSITVDKDFHDNRKYYDRLVIVQEEYTNISYLSRKPVPVGAALDDREYWIKLCGVVGNDFDEEIINNITNAIRNLSETKADLSLLDLYATLEQLDLKLDKSEAEQFATKEDIKDMAKTSDLENLATKEEVNNKLDASKYNELVKNSDIEDVVRKDDLVSLATVQALNNKADSSVVANLINTINELKLKPIININPDDLAKVSDLLTKADISMLETKANRDEIITSYTQLTNRPKKLSDFVNDIFPVGLGTWHKGDDCDFCDVDVYAKITQLDEQLITLKTLVNELSGGTVDDSGLSTIAAQITTLQGNVASLQSGKVDVSKLAEYAKLTDISSFITASALDPYVKTTDLKQPDWTEQDTSATNYILHKPTIPDAQVQSNWDEKDTTSKAFILNKPIIPDAQIQADWEETDTSKKSFIQNKPIIPDVSDFITADDIPEQVQADWAEEDTSKKSFIKNKPTIPESVDLSEIIARLDALEEENKTLKKAIEDLEKELETCVKSDDITTIEKIDPHTYSHAQPGTLSDKVLYLVTD